MGKLAAITSAPVTTGTEARRQLGEVCGPIRREADFGEVVGKSPTLHPLPSQMETVAASDSTVLVLEVAGTGKELVARTIHNVSARRHRSFVSAVAPAFRGLLKSELFSHEREAFTGAIARDTGRYELTDKGTSSLHRSGSLIAQEKKP